MTRRVARIAQCGKTKDARRIGKSGRIGEGVDDVLRVGAARCALIQFLRGGRGGRADSAKRVRICLGRDEKQLGDAHGELCREDKTSQWRAICIKLLKTHTKLLNFNFCGRWIRAGGASVDVTGQVASVNTNRERQQG